MNLHGVIAFVRGKKGILANVLFQVATLSSQALLIWYCSRFFNKKEFDDLFLTAAYITPAYTLLLFGGRQLVLSEKLSERHFLIFRTFGLALLFLFAAVLIEVTPQIGLHIIVAAFGWKIFEYLLDGFSVLCQHRHRNGALNALSMSRIFFFAVPFALDQSFFSRYLMVLTGFVCVMQILALLVSRNSSRLGRPSFKLPLQLGSVALLSALVVSIPRMVLGDSHQVSPGVLGFLSVFAYSYLGGQLMVNSIVPYAITKLRTIEQHEIVVRKIRFLVLYATLAISFGFFAFGLGLYLIAPRVDVLKEFRYLIPWATLIAPLALLSNLIEPFSSLLDAERSVLVSVIVTLAVALAGSWLLVEKADGIGYCIALAFAFFVRAVVSGWMLLGARPSRFGSMQPGAKS